MTMQDIVSRHVAEDRRFIESLTREERRGGPLVPFITGARYRHRLLSALALANLRIGAQAAETKTTLGVLDRRVAEIARGEP